MKNIFLMAICLMLTAFLLIYGEAGLNANSVLLSEVRLPKVITCIFAGGLLALSGLLMQIFFQNPLAGPDILGISSGASLFVALFIIVGAGLPSVILDWGMNAVSFLGAISVFLILLFFVHKNLPKISLIIIGLLISSFAGSGISILLNFSQALQLKNYMLWTMGSFRNVGNADLPRFVLLSIASIFPLIFFMKDLNSFLLSENYAKSMGVNIKRVRFLFITFSALQVSVVTLYCGPVGFIGIIAPHLARQFLKTAKLQSILLASFLIGSCLALFAETVLVFTPQLSISINAILGIIGAPVIILYLYREKGRGLA